MVVICEECGKKYRIDPSKIKGRAASFKCRACTHVIVVAKPETASPPYDTLQSPKSERATVTGDDEAATDGDEDDQKPAVEGRPSPHQRKTRGIGLRAKMFLLFLIIPMIIMAAASFLYFWQLETMSNMLTQESSKIVNQMAEEKIADLSAAVAMQCKLYLMSHPELTKEAFNGDMGFKTLAVQKVGMTGYTALYELPGPDKVWRTWAHVNPKIIAIDMSTLRKTLGANFPGFWKIFSGVKGGKKSQGYYTWQDKDSKFREKFMVCTPIAGTRFVVAATTYLDEFTGPVRQMQSRAKVLTSRARLITWTILGATLLLIGIIVSIYGHRLSSKIRSLTDVADRISVGELGIEIETRSQDEIGELADAIGRMQESIRLSIERLRRRH